MHTQGVCTPISCITSVHLNSTATSTRDLQYACRGEQLTFTCEVMNAASLQWVSEPDILCNNTISYTAGDNEGERRIKGFYQSYLISVARNPPNSNFTSNLTFIPPQSMDSVTVICGNQLSVCSSTEAERTVRITGKYNVEMKERFSSATELKFENVSSWHQRTFHLCRKQQHIVLYLSN